VHDTHEKKVFARRTTSFRKENKLAFKKNNISGQVLGGGQSVDRYFNQNHF
jgi:hypothetical protein